MYIVECVHACCVACQDIVKKMQVKMAILMDAHVKNAKRRKTAAGKVEVKSDVKVEVKSELPEPKTKAKARMKAKAKVRATPIDPPIAPWNVEADDEEACHM